MNPWIAIGLVASALALSMALLSARTRAGCLAPEAARKTLHVEMAAVACAFPWIFASAWPVAVVACVTSAWFGALRSPGALRSRFGPVLHAAARRSDGEFWFAWGVFLAFALAPDRAAYCTAILVLGIADSGAALAGNRWGRPRRMPGGARKSAVGSAAFCAIAFAIAVAVPSLAGNAGTGKLLVNAAFVALLTTLVEALLDDGIDNVAVPMAAIAALRLAESLALPFAAILATGLALALFLTVRRSAPCPS